MSALPKLFRTGNIIVSKDLKLADGRTDLPFASLVGARVEVLQRPAIFATYILGTNAELRQDAGAAKVEVELTSALFAQLTPGEVLTLRWTTKIPDERFTVEPGAFHIDVQEDDIALIAE
jgi:hypothetical protein